MVNVTEVPLHDAGSADGNMSARPLSVGRARPRRPRTLLQESKTLEVKVYYLESNRSHEVLAVLHTSPRMDEIAQATPVHILQHYVYAAILCAPRVVR